MPISCVLQRRHNPETRRRRRHKYTYRMGAILRQPPPPPLPCGARKNLFVCFGRIWVAIVFACRFGNPKVPPKNVARKEVMKTRSYTPKRIWRARHKDADDRCAQLCSEPIQRVIKLRNLDAISGNNEKKFFFR